MHSRGSFGGTGRNGESREMMSAQYLCMTFKTTGWGLQNSGRAVAWFVCDPMFNPQKEK